MKCPDRCIIALLVGQAMSTSLAAQPPERGAPAEQSRQVIATSSDLSSAFPAAEWVRIEQSVDRGLQWLASQQAEDGSFPSVPVGQPAVTSLAVMAFLSRGHLPGQGRYGQLLNRAIDNCLEQQNRRGYF